jgi:hypothetical protein
MMLMRERGPCLALYSPTGSRFQTFAGSRFLKTYFINFVKLDVSRVTGFPEFPNTSLADKPGPRENRGLD